VNSRVILIIIISYFGFSAKGLMAAEYETQLSFYKKMTLTTPISGVVKKLLVVPGKKVKQGDLLLQFDLRRVKANLEKVKSEVHYLTLLKEEAKRELDRELELYDRGLLSNRERDMAKIKYAQSEYQLKSAQASLVKAELELEKSDVLAPYDATVLKLYVQQGQAIVNQLQVQPLLEIAKQGIMQASVFIGLKELRGVSIGQTLKVQINKKKYPAKIESIDLIRQSSSSKYEVTVVVENENLPLFEGQNATVYF